MAADIKIDLALPVGLPPGSPINAKTFPHTVEAVDRVGLAGQWQWRAYLMGAELPDGRKIKARTGAAASSVVMIAEGPFVRNIFSDSPAVRALEEGTRAYDMKNMLRTSSKVRISKKTRARYLIIPFRHGSPGSVGFRSVMPQHVHELAKALLAWHVKSSFQALNVIGLHSIATRSQVMVTRRAYYRGDRLGVGHASKLMEHHKTDPFAGMVRFDHPSGGHSSFLTFRVMSERSTGWIRGAMPGYWAARAASQMVEKAGRAIVQEAFAEDVRGFLTQVRVS